MDPILALHNSARRYCMDRIKLLHKQYSQLDALGRDRLTLQDGGWGYTDEAQDIFPRYNALAAIQREVEQFLPTDFSSLDDARRYLELAGHTAQSPFTNHTNPIAIDATKQERYQFSLFIRKAREDVLAAEGQLPFRRVLGTIEEKNFYNALFEEWGKWYGGATDLNGKRSDAITLHEEAMKAPGAYNHLHEAFTERGIYRVFELRETDGGYELDTEIATFDGSENFWTTPNLDWLVYTSHEASITFGGNWLIDRMRSFLPDFEKYNYKGWDLDMYK
jgi:hypothetical protein